MSEHRHLLKSASTVSTITILSRILGYIRDSRIAYLLGTGDLADAFMLAFRIPNLLRRLVGEGAVNAAVVPVFTGYLTEERKEEAWQFINILFTVATVVMTGVTIVGILLSPLIVRLYASGFASTPGKAEITTLLTRIMFPYIALVSVSALSYGVLNSLRRFAAPAFAPVMLNLTIIAFSFLGGSAFSNHAVALAVGVVVGGILQIAIQIRPLMRSGWRFRPAWDLAHPGLRQVGRMLVPLMFGVGILQINVFVGLQFASRMAEGSVASLTLADRVMELVLGGYTLALSTAILPLLARQAAQRRLDEMRETLNLASRMVLFITIPATIGLVLLRYEIIEVLFQHGEFDARSTALTAHPLMFYAMGLAMISMVKIIVPAFYALKDTRTPVQIGFVSMLLNLGLNFVLIGPFQNGGPALATSLAAVFDSTCLMVIFYRRHGSIGLTDVARSLGKFLVAGAVMAVVTMAAMQVPGFYAGHLGQRVLALGVTIIVAAGTYFGAAYLLRTRELSEVWKMYGQPAVD